MGGLFAEPEECPKPSVLRSAALMAVETQDLCQRMRKNGVSGCARDLRTVDRWSQVFTCAELAFDSRSPSAYLSMAVGRLHALCHTHAGLLSAERPPADEEEREWAAERDLEFVRRCADELVES